MSKSTLTLADLDAQGATLTEEELAAVSGGFHTEVSWKLKGRPAEWIVVE